MQLRCECGRVPLHRSLLPFLWQQGGWIGYLNYMEIWNFAEQEVKDAETHTCIFYTTLHYCITATYNAIVMTVLVPVSVFTSPHNLS